MTKIAGHAPGEQDFNEVAISINGEVVAKSSGPSPALEMIVGLVAELRRRHPDEYDYAHDHPFEPNKQCSGVTCDVCDNTKEWHDERDEVLRRRRAIMPDYDKRLTEWLS